LPSSSVVRKVFTLLRRPTFVLALARYRVAAASEHSDAIRFCGANTLIDAGANKGQFSLAFRRLRPRAKIIAFEPLPNAAEVFERVFFRDPSATLIRAALAAREGTAEFHVADRADSSSLLRPGSGQARAFDVRPSQTIEVPTKRLDDCVDLTTLEPPILLKIDVQGGELGVLKGCAALGLLDFIYVELSFVELYENQPLYDEVCEFLNAHGFAVRGLFNQVSTPDFGPTQVDVLFKRQQQ